MCVLGVGGGLCVKSAQMVYVEVRGLAEKHLMANPFFETKTHYSKCRASKSHAPGLESGVGESMEVFKVQFWPL